jgi:hypothetical protein
MNFFRTICIAIAIGATLSAQPASSHDFWKNGNAVDPVTKALCCGKDHCHVIPLARIHITSKGIIFNLKDAWEKAPGSPGWWPPDEPQAWRTTDIALSPDGENYVCYYGGEIRCVFLQPMGF